MLDAVTLVQAVECQLNVQSSAEQRTAAMGYVEKGLAEPGAWGVLLGLLGPGYEAGVQQQIALLVKNKLHKDLPSMSPSAMETLTGQLLAAYTASQHRLVSLQLSVALAKLLPHNAGQGDIIRQTLCDTSLTQHPEKQVCLLKVLAEEAEDGTDLLLQNIKSNAESVVSMLAGLLSSQAVPTADGLACFNAWVAYTPSVLSGSPFTNEIVKHIDGTALREQSHATAVSLAGLAAGKPEGLGLLQQLSGVLLAAQMRDEVWVQTAAAVGAAASDHVVRAASQEGNFPESVQMMAALLKVVQTATTGDTHLVEATFPMWHALRSSVIEVDEDSRARARAHLNEPLFSLCDHVCRIYELPQSSADWQDIASQRADVGAEVFRDVAWVVTPKEYLLHHLATCQDALKAGSWQRVEAAVYAMACLERMPGPALWEEAAPALLKIGQSLREMAVSKERERVQATYVSLLPRLSKALESSGENLRSSLEMCCEVLGAFDGAGSRAFLRICTSCVEAARMPGVVDMLQKAFLASQQHGLEVQGRVAEGVGGVVWGMPVEQMQGAFTGLVAPAMGRCKEALAASDVASLSCGLAALCALLQTASVWCKSVILDTHDITQPANVANAWMSVANDLLTLLGACAEAGKTSEVIAEQTFGCMGAFVVVTGEMAVPHLQVCCVVVVDFHHNFFFQAICTLVAQSAAHNALPCMLTCMSEVSLACAHIESSVPFVIDTLKNVCDAACNGLRGTDTSPAFSDVPLAKAFFAMLASAVKVSIVYCMFPSPHHHYHHHHTTGGARRRSALAAALVVHLGPTSIQTATHALQSHIADPATLLQVLEMFQNTIAVPKAKEMLAQGGGCVLLKGVVHAIAFKPYECIAPCTKILTSLKKQPAFAEWVHAALAEHSGLEEEEKRDFMETVVASGPGESSAKAAANRMHRAVHSRTAL